MPAFSSICTLFAVVGLTSGSPLEDARATCNADNCLRLVTGSAAGLPSARAADCSSFQLVTVLPAPVTSTVTFTPSETVVSIPFTTVPIYHDKTVTTVYVTPTTAVVVVRSPYSTANESPTGAAAAAKRANCGSQGVRTVTVTVQGNGGHGAAPSDATIRPTSIPGYATTSCPASSRYASACSCAGQTASTTRLATPTSYITVTGAARSTRSEQYIVTAATTVSRNITATVDTIPAVTVTGLPCNDVITPPYGSRDSFRVRCGIGFYRISGSLGSYRDLSEARCLDKCAQTSNCGIARWIYDQTCYLYYGDSQNPGTYNGTGGDAMVMERRGTAAAARPT